MSGIAGLLIYLVGTVWLFTLVEFEEFGAIAMMVSGLGIVVSAEFRRIRR